MTGTLEQGLLKRREQVGCLWAVLLDPDSLPPEELASIATGVEAAGADLLLVGGSSARPEIFEAGMKAIRAVAQVPVVLFPGSYHQVVAGADGILFNTLLSGRNPQYLVNEQVKGAPKLRLLGIEPIPTAYLLIESGHPTTVQMVSGTSPLDPLDSQNIVDHAQAAWAMGMRWVYLEAGSGAERPVPVNLVQQVAQVDGISVICGGGLRSAEAAGLRARAGAAMIVTGNALEVRHDPQYLEAFAQAIHR